MFTTEARRGRNLRLLSIDNGGIRGLSPLLILRDILLTIKNKEGLPDIPRACDVFDLAGGSGTGGISVILLFRLQMSIDAAIDAYLKLSEHVFSEKKWFFQEGTFKATRLEEAMLTIVQQSERGNPKQVPLLNDEGPKCFVSAMNPISALPEFLCSWTSNLTAACTVVEAVRATTAVVTFFKPAPVKHIIPVSFFDGKLRCNNPTLYVLDKAKELYGDRPISCLLSLGTGPTKILGQPPSVDAFQQCLPTRLLRALQDVITDCEQKSREIECELFRHKSSIFYNRLNDDDRRPLAEWRPYDRNCFKEVWPPWNRVLDRLSQVLKDTEVADPTAVHTFQTRPLPINALHEIYHNELLKQGRGWPLWVPGPTPSHPQAYRQDGINVGDVGIIRTDAPFNFLFNIFLPADHPINSKGVPHLFQPLHNSGVDEFPYDMPGTIIGSSPQLSIHSNASGLVFETSIAEGAILVLPQGSWRKTTRDRESMREYMMSNIRAWYQYARKQVFGNGDLVLVYQCDKALSCGMASFSGCEGHAKSLTFRCAKEGGLMFPPFGWKLNHGPGHTSMRIGPYEGENNYLSEVVNNQCVFMCALNGRLSEEEWEEFKPDKMDMA